jgi:DNA-binding LacI/PurR family transcriptional regulator
MANIKDIAQKTGLSVTTVSRVFNNRGYISEQTRKKVADACEELSYKPNEIARALSRKKSQIIGVLMPHVSEYFFAELVEHIEKYLYLNGYKMMLCLSNGEYKKEIAYFELLRSQQVEGAIIGSHTLELDAYSKIDLPMVAFDRYLSPKIPCVSSDHYEGGKLAAKKLIENGCKHIVHMRGSSLFNSPSHERSIAFEDIMKSEHIDYYIMEKEIYWHSKNMDSTLFDTIFEKMPEVDGLFLTDEEAAMMIQYAHKHNIKIPEQLQLIGYDDINLSQLTTPKITTVSQSIDKIGQTLVETLVRTIEGGHQLENMHIKVPVNLSERETTM